LNLNGLGFLKYNEEQRRAQHGQDSRTLSLFFNHWLGISLKTRAFYQRRFRKSRKRGRGKPDSLFKSDAEEDFSIVQKCWHGLFLVYSAPGSGHGRFSPFELYTLRAGRKGIFKPAPPKIMEMLSKKEIGNAKTMASTTDAAFFRHANTFERYPPV
jgi:hypothetical protein